MITFSVTWGNWKPPVRIVVGDCSVGWELRWGGEGEEKVKGRARKDEESEGEDSVHEAMHTPHTTPPHLHPAPATH